jgi:succinate dehydrogenase / fumarate reductase cytochrome b subunit
MGMVTGSWIFVLGEYLVFVAFAFHALNGVRLVLLELGIGVGRPIEPIYPYKTSLHVQRPIAVGVMVLTAALVIVGGLDFFVWH